ncbi:conserved protein of unknown function [Pararobbsia alpina]|uniref:hypothetical protein n=1 Tax=Pararobbsia alpina TaxID=621374 RepID=UPI0039A51987
MRYHDKPHTDGEGWEAVVTAIDSLRDEIGQRHTENTSSIEVIQQELKIAIDRIDDIAKGFPDNDPDGHRRAHEALIKRDEERARLYSALREELVKKGLWAFIVAVLAGLWILLKTKLSH